jgi:TRAP-type uncharacterized transport system substrate-binding protein
VAALIFQASLRDWQHPSEWLDFLLPINHRLLLCLGGVCLAASFLTGCSDGETEVSLITPRLEIDREIAEEFARLFSDQDPVAIHLIPSPDASRAGIEAIKAGTADLALVSNAEPFDPDVATVVPLYPTVLHIIHRTELVANGVLDLIAGHTVFAGPPGSASRSMLEAAAARVGMASYEIDYVEHNRCVDVIVVFAPVLPDLPDRIRDCGDYRMFSLGDPDQIGKGSLVDSVALLNPNIKPFVIPMDTYGSLTPEPVVTLSVDKLLVARKGLPETVVYDLLSEVLRLQPALSAAHPGLFHHLSDRFDAARSSFVLHPGTVAYLQRDEPDFLERYSGVAEVLVTLLIGLVSGGYAIARIYNIRRKNRIDAFCTEAIAIRDRGLNSTDPRVREETIAAVRELQDSAYQMMIQEKLAADDSFRIFITLSNDILTDMQELSRRSTA